MSNGFRKPAAISSHALPSGSVRAIQPCGASESSMKPVGMRVARLSSPQLSGTRERIDLRQLGRVAADDVERLAVRGEDDRVHAVLAAALDLAEQLDLVVAVVAVGVAHAIEAVGAPLVHHHVEAVEGVEQPVGAGEVHADRLGLDRRAAARGRRRHAIELAVLVRGDEPALRVDAQRHPRALGLPSAPSRSGRA